MHIHLTCTLTPHCTEQVQTASLWVGAALSLLRVQQLNRQRAAAAGSRSVQMRLHDVLYYVLYVELAYPCVCCIFVCVRYTV